jgi:hypothetical protein
MPTSPADAPRTVAAALFGTPEEGRRVLHDELLAEDELAGRVRSAATTVVPKGALALIRRQVAEAALEALDISFSDVLTGAWSRYSELMEAAELTRANPGRREDVVLAEHTVTSEHHPRVDVLVDDTLVASIHLQVELLCTIRALTVAVERAAIVEVGSGSARVELSVGADDVPLWRREHEFDVTAVVRLRDGGIPLLPQPRTIVLPESRHEFRDSERESGRTPVADVGED